jgi:hypothetical protein
MKIKCSHCNKEYDVTDDKKGHLMKCECGENFTAEPIVLSTAFENKKSKQTPEMPTVKERICQECGTTYVGDNLLYCPKCCSKSNVRTLLLLWIIFTIVLSIGGLAFAPAYAARLFVGGISSYRQDDLMWCVFFFLLAILNLIALAIFKKWLKK